MFFLGVPKDTVLLTINGQPITTEEYMNNLESEVVHFRFENQEQLNFSTDYGVGDLDAYLKTQTISQVTYQSVVNALTTQLGCEQWELGSYLFPNPPISALSAFFKEKNRDFSQMYCVKEIRCSTLEDAEDCLKQLQADPAQFDALMDARAENYSGENRYWPESGRSLSGNGEAFDTALQSLAVGEMSAVIATPDFYYIIQRIDPLTCSVYINEYQNESTESYLQTQV